MLARDVVGTPVASDLAAAATYAACTLAPLALWPASRRIAALCTTTRKGTRMSSSNHDSKVRAVLQARFTAATATIATLKAAGVNSAAAADAATAFDQQFAVTKEGGQTPLS